jgi:Tol biopolymer transport system component
MTSNNIRTKLIIALLVVLIIAVIIQALVIFSLRGQLYTLSEEQSYIPPGRIVFAEHDDYSIQEKGGMIWKYYLINGDGSNPQYLGHDFQGSPAWSPDSKIIAIGCGDELCLLDIANKPDKRIYPWPAGNEEWKGTYWIYHSVDIIQKITLPAPCRAINAQHRIASLDWAPDGKRLIMVCHDFDLLTDDPRQVCVLSLDGSYQCWDEEDAKSVERVDWSPKEDLVLVTDKEKGIALVNPEGNSWVSIISDFSYYGSGAIWSPDGKQIAFLDTKAELKIIDKDGKVAREFLRPTIPSANCSEMLPGTCRLTWSPDGRFIVFTSHYFIRDMRITRLDLQTGEVIYITNLPPFGSALEPDWEPINSHP